MPKNSESVEPVIEQPTIGIQHKSEFLRVVMIFFRRKLAAVGLFIIVLFILTAIFAPWLAPYEPYKIDTPNKLLPPSTSHLLGTDTLGRDTLSRVIYGSRTSLIIGVSATILAMLIGQSLGLIAATFGGIPFAVIMRANDALMSIPMMVNALIIAALLGNGIENIIIALSVGGIAGHCRMMASVALTIQQNDYIMAGRAMGSSKVRLMLRHVLPNAFPPLLVMTTLNLGMVILSEAALSFLGIGIVPPTCAWGSMVNDGYKYLLFNPILSFAPGLAIMLVVFGFNMVGDGLRDSLDPKLRGVL
jgi:peptide/nickel transport system permease protein